MKEYTKTQTSILDIAQELSQTRGFNGFSYRDIADRIGIRTASIHHHFRTKSDLGTAMTERYRETFQQAVRRLDGDPKKLLEGFAELFLNTLQAGRMCLCGTLAVEYETLPASMQTEVRAFFLDNERWLTEVFRRAKEDGRFSKDKSAEELATAFLSALEGAMMSARALGEARRFRVTVEQFLQAMN
ncbi:MAG: TetR/AcrR family transcriptional regulator [Myxococcota bacterium]